MSAAEHDLILPTRVHLINERQAALFRGIIELSRADKYHCVHPSNVPLINLI